MSAFLVVRHARSTWNASGRWQGQADPPLSADGEELCLRAAAGLEPFDLVITSDLERARRTAELLTVQPPRAMVPRGPVAAPTGLAEPRVVAERPAATAPPVVVEPYLREFHVGSWSGLTRAEIQQRWPSELALFDSGVLPAAPGGETREGFDARVLEAARRVAHLIADRGAKRTLVVTHGGVIRSLVRSSGRPERHVPNLAGYAGTAGAEGVSLHRAVDLAHHPASESEAAGPPIL